MTPEIVLIRDGDQFLLLHGHLGLANVLVNYGSVHLDVRGEGIVRVTRNKSAYFVVQNGKWLPIVEGPPEHFTQPSLPAGPHFG